MKNILLHVQTNKLNADFLFKRPAEAAVRKDALRSHFAPTVLFLPVMMKLTVKTQPLSRLLLILLPLLCY